MGGMSARNRLDIRKRVTHLWNEHLKATEQP